MTSGIRRIDPEVLLKAYTLGIFPMAESRTDPDVVWVDPHYRGILPLDRFHVPRRLARTIRRDPFRITVDTAFPRVIEACAGAQPGRGDSWINTPIYEAYCALAGQGRAHSVECWAGERLVGGLYGVRLGGAFFGESMFSLARDASKIALVHLAARLIRGRFVLLDTQFVTAHLRQFGAIELPRGVYHDLLHRALDASADFRALPPDRTGAEVLEIVSSPGT
ncbi:MAG: leucyl/phenylalanyl-tRNA--protein transferase [Alphaproteobacteria bacterium]